MDARLGEYHILVKSTIHQPIGSTRAERTHTRVCVRRRVNQHTGSVVRVSLSDPITTNSLKAKTAEKVREREMAFNVGWQR